MEYGGDSSNVTSGTKSSGEKTGHRIVISERQSGVITGVKDVNEFDSNCINIDTKMGRLLIKGRDLKVKGLNLERGEAEITGRVDHIQYASSGEVNKASKKSLWSKM